MTNHLWTGAIGLMYPSDYGYASSGSSEICNYEVMSNWSPYEQFEGDDGYHDSGNDVAYAECAQNSWLYDSSRIHWTLTPCSDLSSYVVGVSSSGNVRNYAVYSGSAVRLVLFLNSNVKIVGGLGTFDQPFELGV